MKWSIKETGVHLLFWLISYWIFLVSFAVNKSFVDYLRNERLQQALLQEKLSTELQFLKAQINPHFLFNTLNNLFAMAEKSEQQPLAEGISELANLMRYMLHEANADRVPLAREIAYIQSVIELQQLRLDEDDDVLISLNVEGNAAQQEIAPLLLIPFVENAFKHGIYLQGSSYIKINLKIDDKQIYFHLINSKFDQQLNELQESSGIGLENVKRRLALIYPDQHD